MTHARRTLSTGAALLVGHGLFLLLTAAIVAAGSDWAMEAGALLYRILPG